MTEKDKETQRMMEKDRKRDKDIVKQKERVCVLILLIHIYGARSLALIVTTCNSQALLLTQTF
jgi:hypothetical protein